jgi:hypothetical protein
MVCVSLRIKYLSCDYLHKKMCFLYETDTECFLHFYLYSFKFSSTRCKIINELINWKHNLVFYSWKILSWKMSTYGVTPFDFWIMFRARVLKPTDSRCRQKQRGKRRKRPRRGVSLTVFLRARVLRKTSAYLSATRGGFRTWTSAGPDVRVCRGDTT